MCVISGFVGAKLQVIVKMPLRGTVCYGWLDSWRCAPIIPSKSLPSKRKEPNDEKILQLVG
jgi:hypothetical protein